MSAPDSWEQMMEPRPGQGGDFNDRFRRMNVNAQSFVPNVQAQPFVPYGPYGGYPMPSHPHIRPGMYPPPPPGMQMSGHMPGQGYMMHPWMQTAPHAMQHGMGIPQHRPVATLESEQPHMPVPGGNKQQHFPPHSSVPPTRQGFSDPTTAQRNTRMENLAPTKTQEPPKGTKISEPPIGELGNGKPEVPPPENPVDSWEEIADSETPQPVIPPSSSSTTSSSSSLPPIRGSEVESKTDSSSSGRSTPKSQELPLKETLSSSASASSTPDLAKLERKHPSPSLSERNSRGEGTGSGRPSKSSQAPPPKKEDEKENVNIVFIGHVDAGKSTIGGHVLYLTGQVDKRTLEKYEREAKEKNRETWYLSWALDTNQEERDKGKTVEVGRASFETDRKRFTILDAPGHAGFVPNMISGAAQADIGVLVISARRGEFETGFERRGQTREHAMLAKTAGVKHLVVLINKMDDSTVHWDENRFEECKTKLTPFLKKVGFNPKTDIVFIPVSGLTGANIKDVASEEICPWYRGPPFITYLDDLPPLSREDAGPCRIPISDKYKDMGTIVMGKVESGGVMKGTSLILMPNKASVEVISIQRNEEEVSAAYSGDNVRLKLKGVEEEDISSGFVLCDSDSLCHVGSTFDAQIAILEHKSIICAGYSAVLHIHCVVEEVQIKQLIALIDRKTGKKIAQRPRFVKQDQVVIARLQTAGVICLETFKEFPQMARFTLRDEGKTIAIGKVLKLVDTSG